MPHSAYCLGALASDPEHPYVGRGGLKLEYALREFDLDVTGLRCADFGCNIGGFTDCLLRHGAAHVFAIDTGYGALAYKLRIDPRVTVMERTNVLHADPPSMSEAERSGVDLVVADMGWTPQRLVIPAAVRWLTGAMAGDNSPDNAVESQSPERRVITLIKPHYELTDRVATSEREASSPSRSASKLEQRDRRRKRRPGQRDGGVILSERESEEIVERIVASLPALGVTVANLTCSPIRGGASRGRRGNIEYLALLRVMKTS